MIDGCAVGDSVQSSALSENPWIKYNANRRGYVRIDMDRTQLRADLQLLPYVSRPAHRA